MIIKKTPAEIGKIAEAGTILVKTLALLQSKARRSLRARKRP